jgi:tetratricopeptide (TPR) repeat protein
MARSFRLTDRHSQTEAFHVLLQDSQRWIMPLCGLSGMGKSFLFDHLVRIECQRLNVPYARVDLGSAYLRGSYLRIMDELELGLGETIPTRHWSAYRRQREEALRRLSNRKISLQQRVIIADNSVGQNITQRIDMGDALRLEEERTQHTVTDAFARCVARKQGPLVVFVDGWENVQAQEDPSLSAWLLDGLFAKLHGLRPGTRLIVAGRRPFRHPSLLTAVVPCSELDEFSRADSAAFLSGRGVSDPLVQELVYDWVRGHPLLTAMLADQGEETLKQGLTREPERSLETVQVIADWVRGRILERLPPADRHLLRYGVVLRRFDLDTLRALFPEKALDHDTFNRFVGYSFVERRESGWVFYELVRQGQLHELRDTSEQDYLDYHQHALAYYEGRRDSDRHGARRRLRTLEVLYHRFCVDERAGLDAWWQEVRDAERAWDAAWWQLLLELPAARDLDISDRVKAWSELGWGKYFNQRAQWDRALDHCRRALDLMEREHDLRGQAEVHAEIGDLTFKQGQDWDGALDHLRLSLECWERVDDAIGIMRTRNQLGRLYSSQSEWEQALVHLEQVRDTAAEHGDREALARALFHIGDVRFFQGDWDRALTTYERSLDLFREIDNSDGIIESLNGIGQVYEGQGKWDAALAQFEESIRLCEDHGNDLRRGETLASIGHLYEEQGVWSTALTKYEQAHEIAERIGDAVGMATAKNCLGEVHEVLGDLELALSSYGSALKSAQRINLRHLMGTVACNVACVYLKQNRTEEAAREFERSIGIYEEISNLHGLAACYNNLALLYHTQERWADTAAAFERSLSIKEDLGDTPGQISTLYNLSRFYEERTDIPQAIAKAQQMVALEAEIDHPALLGDLLRLEQLERQLEERGESA